VETFPTPEGIVFMRVNKQTGQLSTDGGAATIYECFLEGTKPSEQSFGYPEEKEDLFR